MASIEKLKKIYEDTKPQLAFCQFVNEFDPNKFEMILNHLAKEEEPLSVLCIGEATLKGILSTFSPGAFLFTNDKFYIEKRTNGINYSDISILIYEEEEKKGLFGKTKLEGHLILKKNDGSQEDYTGNYATKEIADFLNYAVKELRDNPMSPLLQKDCLHADEIAVKIKNLFSEDLSNWYFKGDIPHKALNSLIIQCAKDEYKSSCSAYYKISDCEMYWFNDTLYLNCKSSAGDSKNWHCEKYNELAKVVYEEDEKRTSDGGIRIEKYLTIYNKDEKPVLFSNNSSLTCEKFANFFSIFISEETGKKTETEIIKREAPPLVSTEQNEPVNHVSDENSTGGILKALGKFAVSAIDKGINAASAESSVTIFDENNFYKLLEKWDSIFQRQNFIVDPKISVEEKTPEPFTSYVARNRFSKQFQRRPQNPLRNDRVISVTKYLSGNSELELYSQKVDIRYYRENAAPRYEGCSRIEEFYLEYKPDIKNEKKLTFSYLVEDWNKSADPRGFILMSFGNENDKIKTEAVIYVSDYKLNNPSSFHYGEDYIGLKKMLSLLNKDSFYEHLKVFVESPYTISEEEKQRQEKEAEEIAEQQRIELEKLEEEKRKKEELKRQEEELELQKRKEQRERLNSDLDSI